MSLSAIAENLSCPITRAGVHERLNERACDFLQGVYTHFYKTISTTQNFSMAINLFNKFRHIQIADSTAWKIPASLKETFAGSNLAGCKTQFLLDYKTGLIQLLDILPQNSSDQQYSKTLHQSLQADDLSIFDLGFAIPQSLQMIDSKGAFFICRYNHIAINLYLKDGATFNKTNVLQLLTKLGTHQAIYEIPCYVGTQDIKIKVLLIAIEAPEEVTNRRREKLRKDALKKHRNSPTEQSLQLCRWTLLMTNIPPEKGLSLREIISLYSIRWTIEIFFKQLKSILNIHKTCVKENPHRFKAEVLARCLVAMFITYCYSLARTYSWRKTLSEISFEKTIKYFKRNAAVLLGYLLSSPSKAIAYLQHMIFKIIATCQKYRQASRKNSLDILLQRSIYKHLKIVKLSRAKLLDIMA